MKGLNKSMIQDFMNNPIICGLAQNPYWTINIDNKKPLDIINYKNTKYIRGAYDINCLTTLSDLISILNAIPQQFVYSLNAVRDNICVLDIEKKCPDEIKQRLLKLPFLYGDISMSGEGYHLVFPCPELDEKTRQKIVMKEEHGYYEILLNHYVTFTDKTIFPVYDNTNTPISFQEIWDEIKATQKIAEKECFDISAGPDIDFPEYESFKTAILRSFNKRFQKKPDDYFNDMSRYEFGVIGSLRISMLYMLDMPMFKHVVLDTAQQIWIIYQLASEILEHRPKHDEIRDNKPWLLYQTYSSFTTKYKN